MAKKNELSLANQLGLLIAISATAHYELGNEKNKDKGGNPYILHPMRIMLKFEGNFVHMMVAIAHDLIEDTDWTIDRLKKAGITNDEVLDALVAITKVDGTPYYDYIMVVSENLVASDIKMEDLQDNSLLTRLKGVRHKDFTRGAKYNAAFMYLGGKITAAEFKAVLNDIGVP